MKVFFVFSLLCCAILLACFITATALHQIVPPQETGANRPLPAVLSALPFLHTSFTATMIAIGILVISVPVTMFLLFHFFENTQSSEIIFFTGVLGGMLCESMRFLIPLFGLGMSFSHVLLIAGRILIFGRLAVPLCSLCIAIFSDPQQRQDVERNVAIALSVSAVCAAGIPLNTAQITTTCAVSIGFSAVFAIVRFLIFALTMLSFAINAKKHDSPELKKMLLYYLVLIVGYSLLLRADTFVVLALGAAALAYGTVSFLRTLHRLYKWK